MASTGSLLVHELPGSWKGLLFVATSIVRLTWTRTPIAAIIVGAGITGALMPW